MSVTLRHLSPFAAILLIACSTEEVGSAAEPTSIDKTRIDASLDFLAEQRAVPVYGTFTAGTPCTIAGDVPQQLLAEGELRWADPIAVIDVALEWIADGAPPFETYSRAVIARTENGALLADRSPAFAAPSEGLLFLARLASLPSEIPPITCDGAPYTGGFVPYTFLDRARFEGVYSVDEITANAQAGFDRHDYEGVEADWTYLTVHVDDGPPT